MRIQQESDENPMLESDAKILQESDENPSPGSNKNPMILKVSHDTFDTFLSILVNVLGSKNGNTGIYSAELLTGLGDKLIAIENS